MSTHSIRPEHAATPAFVKPFLHTFDRLQRRETLHPEQLTEHARALLVDYFGPSTQTTEAAFARGCLNLIGEHTHFFEGFALMLPLPHGVALAVRQAAGPVSRVAFEGRGAWTIPADTSYPPGPMEVRVLETLIRRLAPPGMAVEMAVVGTVPACDEEALLAALGIATARALQALPALSDDTATLLRRIHDALVSDIERPTSMAYLLASEAAHTRAFMLVDTHTLECIPVEAPDPELVCWALVTTGQPAPVGPAFYRKRQEKTAAALDVLHHKGFAGLASFRDLEHQDLQRALHALPRRLRPIVRHLVTENRNVQKLVAAVRRRDWQMSGNLLLMSHGSYRKDWGNTGKADDFVVEQARALTLEGLYGARMTGAGGCVLVMGQPFTVPQSLDRISQAFEARFGSLPPVLLF